MLFLIFDNAIAGTTTQAEGLPNQFEAIEGPDMPLELVYWDGQAIKLKPPQPSETAYWNPQAKEWQEPQVPVPTGETEPNWDTQTVDGDRTTTVKGLENRRTDQNLTINCGQTITLATDSGASLTLDTSGAVIIRDAFGHRWTLGGSGGSDWVWDLNGATVQIINAGGVTIDGHQVAVVGARDSDNDTLVTRGY